jgi:putative Mn2+ efflux pump MntP
MMDIMTIILVAIVLGADSFSLALGMALRGVSPHYEYKFSATVGLFHIIMPLIGLNIGLAAGNLLGVWASRVGALVLVGLGVDMLLKGYRSSRPRSYKFSQGKEMMKDNGNSGQEGWTAILLLATSVSIDALTVGFSLGTFKMPILLTVILMGIIAGSMTLLGFKGGKLFGRLMGSYAQMAGGIVLVLLALKMVF